MSPCARVDAGVARARWCARHGGAASGSGRRPLTLAKSTWTRRVASLRRGWPSRARARSAEDESVTFTFETSTQRATVPSARAPGALHALRRGQDSARARLGTRGRAPRGWPIRRVARAVDRAPGERDGRGVRRRRRRGDRAEPVARPGAPPGFPGLGAVSRVRPRDLCRTARLATPPACCGAALRLAERRSASSRRRRTRGGARATGVRGHDRVERHRDGLRRCLAVPVAWTARGGQRNLPAVCADLLSVARALVPLGRTARDSFFRNAGEAPISSSIDGCGEVARSRVQAAARRGISDALRNGDFL